MDHGWKLLLHRILYLQIGWILIIQELYRAVYWIGTYEAPTEYVEEYSWTSQRDKEKTDVELLASTDDTKIFTYSNGELRYEVSMMNVTKEVTLKK